MGAWFLEWHGSAWLDTAVTTGWSQLTGWPPSPSPRRPAESPFPPEDLSQQWVAWVFLVLPGVWPALAGQHGKEDDQEKAGDLQIWRQWPVTKVTPATDFLALKYSCAVWCINDRCQAIGKWSFQFEDTEVVRHLMFEVVRLQGSEIVRLQGSEIVRHLGFEVVRNCFGGSEVVRH